MPTSGLGSEVKRRGALRPGRATGGFTMVELLIVMAVIAVGIGLVALALPDGEASRLDEEGERLVMLLETARAESRVSGAPVWWVPRPEGEGSAGERGEPVNFRFVGLPSSLKLPSRWLDERVSAQVLGARQLVLGPSAILPPQRVVLSLGERRLELSSDGLGAFSTEGAASAPNP
jgi:general secretion pathway protein H